MEHYQKCKEHFPGTWSIIHSKAKNALTARSISCWGALLEHYSYIIKICEYSFLVRPIYKII